MTTLRQVNKALVAKGYKFALVRGDGYFYFEPTGKDDKFGPTVYVCYLNQLSLDRWVEELEEFLKEQNGN